MQRIRSSDHHLLTENVIKFLINNRIYTILDYLQEDVDKLSALTKLTLPQVLAVRLDFINKYSASVVNGSTLFSKSLTSKNILSTGIARLDTILNGGIPTGSITEVCGLAGSGKSNLCIQLCINCVQDNNCDVLYIDTKGDFSAVKLQRIMQACGYSHKDMALIMTRIKVVQVWTMDELIELLMKLKKKDIYIENLKLILIDSLPCLMFQYLGDDRKVGLSLLNVFSNYCKYLCQEYNWSILCVNIQTRWIEHDIFDVEDDDSTGTVKDQRIEKRNRGLGKYWQYIPSLVLLLEMPQDKNDNHKSECYINLTVIKSNFCLCNLSCSLLLGSLGVI